MRVWWFLRGTGAANIRAPANPHLTVVVHPTASAWIACSQNEEHMPTTRYVHVYTDNEKGTATTALVLA